MKGETGMGDTGWMIVILLFVVGFFGWLIWWMCPWRKATKKETEYMEKQAETNALMEKEFDSSLSRLKGCFIKEGIKDLRMIPSESEIRSKGKKFGIGPRKIENASRFVFAYNGSYTKFGVINTTTMIPFVFEKSQLLDYSLYKNGTMVPRGNTGSVIMGGLAFGVVGALAGAAKAASSEEICTDLTIEIILANSYKPRLSLPLLESSTSPSSSEYREKVEMAQDILAVLKNIKES